MPKKSVTVANPDGSNVQQVPLPEGIRVELFSGSVWSPDGTKLLISHTLRLDNTGQCCLFQPATVKPDGSEFNQLVPPTPPGGPSANGIDCWVWTLDQSRILCAFDDENAGAFSIRASDGGDPVRLTTDPGGQDLPTDISPDWGFVLRSMLRLPHDSFMREEARPKRSTRIHIKIPR